MPNDQKMKKCFYEEKETVKELELRFGTIFSLLKIKMGGPGHQIDTKLLRPNNDRCA